MADASEQHQVPKYFANFVTSQINTDELYMELRRFFTPHETMIAGAKPDSALLPVPAPSAEQVMKEQPIAIVVMTFSAAKALKEYLEKALPEIEAQRKGQS